MLIETMETSGHVDYQMWSRLLLWGVYKQILRQTTFMALQKICLIISYICIQIQIYCSWGSASNLETIFRQSSNLHIEFRQSVTAPNKLRTPHNVCYSFYREWGHKHVTLHNVYSSFWTTGTQVICALSIQDFSSAGLPECESIL